MKDKGSLKKVFPGHLRLTIEVLSAFVLVLIFRVMRLYWIIIDDIYWMATV